MQIGREWDFERRELALVKQGNNRGILAIRWLITWYLLVDGRVWDRTENRNTNRKVQDFGWTFSVKIKSGGQVEKCVQDPQVGGYLPLCICMLGVGKCSTRVHMKCHSSTPGVHLLFQTSSSCRSHI